MSRNKAISPRCLGALGDITPITLELTVPVFSVCVGVLPLAPSNALRKVAVRNKERILWHLIPFLLTADSIDSRTAGTQTRAPTDTVTPVTRTAIRVGGNSIPIAVF